MYLVIFGIGRPYYEASYGLLSQGEMAGGNVGRPDLPKQTLFELCELPRVHKPVAWKWDLKIKRGAQGEIEQFKARYMAKGFTQVHGVDLFDTWAPVGRYATLHMLQS